MAWNRKLCVAFKTDLQGSSSLWLCHREQSSAASLPSTGQGEEKKSGRRECCHSARPDGTWEKKKIQKLTIKTLFFHYDLWSHASPVSDNLSEQGRPHSRSASNTTSPCWQTHHHLPHLCADPQPHTTNWPLQLVLYLERSRVKVKGNGQGSAQAGIQSQSEQLVDGQGSAEQLQGQDTPAALGNC